MPNIGGISMRLPSPTWSFTGFNSATFNNSYLFLPFLDVIRNRRPPHGRLPRPRRCQHGRAQEEVVDGPFWHHRQDEQE